MTAFTPPAAYYMCSEEECSERLECGEVSVFECTEETAHLSPKQRVLDTTRAVAKYRRAAAGAKDTRPLRSWKQLSFTVNYLSDILVHQSASKNSKHKQTFRTTAAFVEDRFRAVQVEVVKLQYSSPKLQLLMAKCHILILYLLSDCKDYERKFGLTALQTALSSYWNATLEERIESWDDEILAYALLCQLNLYLTGLEDSLSSVLATYRRHAPTRKEFPLFQWALRLTVTASLGLWHSVLKQLQTGLFPPSFHVLARCWLATSVPAIRANALETYNSSFGKNEAVSGQSVARLLFISSSRTVKSTWDDDEHEESAEQAAIRFGASLDLPRNDSGTCLLFKVSPLKEISTPSLTRDDAFVFGSVKGTADNEGVVVPSADYLLTILRE